MGYDLYVEQTESTRPTDDAPFEKWRTWFDAVQSEGGYFRFSIWGMEPMRQVLHQLGMLDLTTAPPAYGEATTDAEWERAVRQELPVPIGIPVYKLCSNDGWLVTPREIQAAFTFFDPDKFEAVLSANEYFGTGKTADERKENMEYGRSFFRWMRLAAKGGGFRVW